MGLKPSSLDESFFFVGWVVLLADRSLLCDPAHHASRFTHLFVQVQKVGEPVGGDIQ